MDEKALARGALMQFSERLDAGRVVRPSRRTIAAPSPAPAAQHTPFRRTALLLLEPVSLVAKVFDLRPSNSSADAVPMPANGFPVCCRIDPSKLPTVICTISSFPGFIIQSYP